MLRITFAILLFVLYPSVRALDVAEVYHNEPIYQMVGDPVAPIAYIVGRQPVSIMVLNTDTGRLVRSVDMVYQSDGQEVSLDDVAYGDAALSFDRARLYVALYGSQKIQCYDTSDLHLIREIDLPFTCSRVVVTKDEILCIAQGGQWNGMSTVNATTGAVLAQTGSFYAPLLRLGDSGTTVYEYDRWLSGGGDFNIASYDISPTGDFTSGPVYRAPMANSQDFSVSELDQKLWSMNGGVYGITTTDMVTNTSEFKPFFAGEPYGAAVVQLPGQAYVYGSSYQAITQYRKSDMVGLRHIVPRFGDLYPVGMVITGHQNVVFRANANHLGLIGSATLHIEDDKPISSFTSGPSGVQYRYIAESTATAGDAPIAGYEWSLDGSWVGNEEDLTLEFAAGDIGQHVLRLVVTDAYGNTACSSRDVTFDDSGIARRTLTVSNGSGAGRYVPGETVSIVANSPPYHQVFWRWTGMTVADANQAATTLVMPDGDVTVTAEYTTAPTYQVTVNGGSGSGMYFEGDFVEIHAADPVAGMRFWLWTGFALLGNSTYAHTYFTMPGAPVVVTANYQPQPYNLTIIGGTGTGSYPTGTVVFLQASTAPTGFAFSGWTVTSGAATIAVSTSPNTTLTTSTQATTVQANYSTGYTLTVNHGSGSGTYAAGTTVAITADASPAGRRFLAWKGAAVGDHYDPSTTIILPMADTTVTATYTAKSSDDVMDSIRCGAGSGLAGFATLALIFVCGARFRRD